MYPWIYRDIPWMPCWFALLYIYMYFGYTMYPWISRDVSWMPCWFALLYMYMYFGYTMYPLISRDVPWMPCWIALLYMYMYMYFGYTMDIQSCSMDALLVCTTVHVRVVPWRRVVYGIHEWRCFYRTRGRSPSVL